MPESTSNVKQSALNVKKKSEKQKNITKIFMTLDISFYNEERRIAMAKWKCPSCGWIVESDIQAACGYCSDQPPFAEGEVPVIVDFKLLDDEETDPSI
ncbi:MULTISPECIES: hypothetical protein [Paenibacillus]|uniref:hypothetical protein n=2 Tax=Paenibacillus TaxID=44249 RepID=UPI001BCD8C83|nr:hypothetical protein [Paenibacillus dendritiformis]